MDRMANPIRMKELAARGDLLTGGHRACAGCACATAVRQAMMAAEDPVVVAFATGCMEVSTTIYPYTAWKVPYIHSCFENAAATASGVEAAYQAFRRQGKIDKKVKFIAFGGDGGSYDIGIQSISGAMERGHDMLYICYNNGAYMNTGIQRSSATPRGASTTTAPPGKGSYGKKEYPKDLTEIIVAHGVPYVAQSTPAHHLDFMKKVRRALEIEGPTFINVLASCNRGWRIPSEQSIDILRLAADSCFWPIYEVENGRYKINYRPREKKPILEWLKAQKRYEHLFRKGDNTGLFEEMQRDVDARWDRLQRLEALWT
jgi:pyruvate ferredoxin oxidoreductase beta subunit